MRIGLESGEDSSDSFTAAFWYHMWRIRQGVFRSNGEVKSKQQMETTRQNREAKREFEIKVNTQTVHFIQTWHHEAKGQTV